MISDNSGKRVESSLPTAARSQFSRKLPSFESVIVDTPFQSPLFAVVTRLRESLSMNARVFLVVLLTATFMAVWDADQKAMNIALAQKQLTSERPNQVVVKRQQPRVHTAQPLASNLPVVQGQADSIKSFIPLPRSLASGTWKAIGESGQIYSITIGRVATEGPRCLVDNSLEDHFAIITGEKGDRWCFVRSRAGLFSEPRSASAEITPPGK